MATPIKRSRNELDATAQKFTVTGFAQRQVWRKNCAHMTRLQYQARSERLREAANHAAQQRDQHREHMRKRYVTRRITFRAHA